MTSQHAHLNAPGARTRVALSSAQLRVLIEHDLNPASRVYHYGFELLLRGALNVTALERALNELVEAHEPLRTTIAGFGPDAVQVIHRENRIVLPPHEVLADTPEDRQAAIHKTAAELTGAPMDLRAEFPLRLRLLRFSEDDHALVFMMHHIAIDAWSMVGYQSGHWNGGVFMRHLTAFYEAACGHSSTGPEAPRVRYSDYAAAQAQWRESDRAAQATQRAAQAISGANLQTELPADRMRANTRVAAGGKLSATLPGALSAALRDLAGAERATLFMVLLAGFSAELGRSTGQDTITVLTSTAGRDRPEDEDLIGNFINLVPLCVDLRGNPTFGELISRSRRAVIDGWGRHRIPFEDLSAALDTPLPRVLLELQPALMRDPIEVVGVSMMLIELERAEVDYDLNVVFTVGHDIEIVAHYSRALFDPATIERLVTRLSAVLERAVADKDRTCASLCRLDAQDRQLLEDWGAGPRAFQGDMSLPELLDQRATEDGDRLAIVNGSAALTYRALAASVERLAAHLCGKVVGSDPIVAIHAPRGCEFLIGILGAFKAGVAYLPLSPADPPARRLKVLATSGASHLLIQGPLDFEVPPGVNMIDIGDIAEGPDQPMAPDWPPHRSANLAYVIYTSGSTGVPKGAMVEQAGMLNHLHAKAWDLKLTKADRIAQTAPVSFDIAVWQFLLPLFVGGTVHIYDDATRMDPARLLAQVEDDGITVLEVVPSFLGAMLDTPDLPALSRLRWLVVTGEALPVEIARRWFERYPAIPLVNAYGPTECSDDVTHHVMADPPPQGALSIPIGRPVAGAQLYVLDAGLQPVPVGIVGELCVAGVGVGRGYLRDPRTTAGTFVPDPLSGRAGGRLYRTGDRARFLPDGCLEFLGRMDHQIKLRGHRIEVGEIEAILADHPDLRQAVVVRRAWAGSDHLIAFVGARKTPLGDADRAALATSVQDHAARLLPEIMVPSLITVVDEIPLTANGKANRNLLETAPLRMPNVRAGPRPRTQVETLLAGIWTDVLKVPDVRLDDNFFTLGGDSIQLLRIVAHAARVGLSISPAQVFANPTLGALSNVAGAPQISPADELDISGPTPLTPLQHWVLSQPSDDPSHWNLLFEFDVPGRFSEATLDAGLRAVVEQHEMLRLSLRGSQDSWHLAPQEDDERPLVETHRARSLADIKAVRRRLHRALDLRHGPLLRAARIEFDGQVKVMLVVHHLIVDGLSLSIVLEDFAEACGQIDRGEDIKLLPATTSFRRCSALLEQRARDIDAGLAEEWRSRLSEATPIRVDAPGGLYDDIEKNRRTFSLSLTASETQALHRQPGLSPPVALHRILLSAVGAALQSWNAGPTQIDIETDGRVLFPETYDVSRTVGPLSTIVPLVLDIPPEGTVEDRLRALTQCFDRLPGRPQDYGVLRYLRKSAALADAPTAQVLFDYLGSLDHFTARQTDWHLGGIEQEGARDPLARRPYLLEFQVLEVEKRLRIDIRYGPSVFSEAAIQHLGQALQSALDAAIAHVRSPEARATDTLADLRQNWSEKESETFHTQAIQRTQRYDDLIRLTPLQQGLLFHALRTPQAGMYVTQAVWSAASFDPDAMGAAWKHLLTSHPVLRSSVLWEAVPEPVLVVHRDVNIPIEVHDWRDAPGDAPARFDTLLAQDRQNGVDMAAAPMMRITAVQLSDADWRVLWTHHHVLLDGWSVAELLKRLAAKLRSGAARPDHGGPRSRSFSAYVDWLYRQDVGAKSRDYWHAQLEGVRSTPLPLSAMARGGLDMDMPGVIEEATEHLTGVETAALDALARRLGITISTLARAAWSLLLAGTADADRVLFGVTASGRTTGFRGAEEVIGMLLNTTPFVAPVPRDATIRDWLTDLHHLEAGRMDHELASLTDIKRWSGRQGEDGLFSTLVVVQNYPPQHDFPDLRLLTTNNYPLVLRVVPGARLRLMMLYRPSVFGDGAIHRLLGELKAILAAFADPEQTVGTVLDKLSSGLKIDEQRRFLQAILERKP